MNSHNYIFSHKVRKARNKKQNGFTMVELMVAVAIVGVLSAVGLPQLTKAQDNAKEKAATSIVTNAAKECSLSLIMNGDATDYDSTKFKIKEGGVDKVVQGNCADNTTLSLTFSLGQSSNTFSTSTPGVTEFTPTQG